MAYGYYVEAFHKPPTAEGRGKLQQVMKQRALPAEIASQLFTCDAFMLNVGRVDVSESTCSRRRRRILANHRARTD
jgi:hypothetical protein